MAWIREASGLSDELRDTTGFLYEIGLLKRYKRTGWSRLGVPLPESVADHSFRVSVIASVLAAMEGADPQRAAFLALWHDSQETRTTDLPHLTKSYVSAAAQRAGHQDQVAPLPPPVAGMISAAVAEYEAAETPEARCARDADKLECLLQAREYQDQGHTNVQPWIDSSLAALTTPSAKQFAHEAIAQNSLDWLERAKQAAAGTELAHSARLRRPACPAPGAWRGSVPDAAEGLDRCLVGVGQGVPWRRRILELSECLALWLGSAADVGGVAGPVSAAGSLPGDSDGDVDAEHAGEEGCGQVGCELEECGGSGLAGVEAELAEPFGELVGAEWAAGLSSGEQPA